MSTEKQIKANRENGKKGGVKTIKGREKIKYNALKHGILSNYLTDFDNELYKDFYENLKSELEPIGFLENMILERIAIYYVKLFRISKIESDDFRKSLDPTVFGNNFFEIVEEVVEYEGYTPQIQIESIRNLDLLWRYEKSIESRLYKNLHELERIQSNRKSNKIELVKQFDLNINSDNKMGLFGNNTWHLTKLNR